VSVFGRRVCTGAKRDRARRTRINDVLDAIEATAKLKRTSLVEHTSEIKIRNLPEATISRMAKLSNTIDAYPGSLLMQATAAADAANPSDQKRQTTLH